MMTNRQQNISTKQPQTASPRKIAANRRNAARSTGPRTPRGKYWSRRNALRHGFLAATVVHPIIDGDGAFELFDQVLELCRREYRPLGPIEELLVEKIVIGWWNLRRLSRLQNQLTVSDDSGDESDPLKVAARDSRSAHDPIWHRLSIRESLALLSGCIGPSLSLGPRAAGYHRYYNSFNREFYRALAELRRVQTLDRPRLHPELKGQLPPVPEPLAPLREAPEPEWKAKLEAEKSAEGLYRYDFQEAKEEELRRAGLSQEQADRILGVNQQRKPSAPRTETPAPAEAQPQRTSSADASADAPASATEKNDETKPNSPDNSKGQRSQDGFQSIADEAPKEDPPPDGDPPTRR